MLDLFKSFVDLGAIVVLPILIFIFGVALGTKPKKALVSGIMVGIGFVGLNMVVDLLGERRPFGRELGPCRASYGGTFWLELDYD